MAAVKAGEAHFIANRSPVAKSSRYENQAINFFQPGAEKIVSRGSNRWQRILKNKKHATRYAK
jgi:hypothetical protein